MLIRQFHFHPPIIIQLYTIFFSILSYLTTKKVIIYYII
nr:MAG TPA: hypothetical protein [Bacteriophage sp.]